VNYTVKRYFFEQSAVREFYSGAYYDLFLVMRGSGVRARHSANVRGAGAACLHPCRVPHRIGQPPPPDAGRGVFVYSGAPYRGADAGTAGERVFRFPGTYCPGIQTPDRADGAPLYRKGAVRPLLHPHRAGAAHHRGVQDQRLWRLQPLFPRLQKGVRHDPQGVLPHHPAGRPGMNPAKAAPSAPVKKAARFASDFRVRSPARSAKGFWA